jgi:hypothetical protein
MAKVADSREGVPPDRMRPAASRRAQGEAGLKFRQYPASPSTFHSSVDRCPSFLLATLIDDEGLSARIGADHLGRTARGGGGTGGASDTKHFAN